MQIRRGKDGKVKMVAVDYEDQYFGVAQLKHIYMAFVCFTFLMLLAESLISRVSFAIISLILAGIYWSLERYYDLILISEKEKGDSDSRASEED